MFCPRCGTNNSGTATFCVQCGNALRESQQQQQQLNYVPNYLVQAILVTLFCCLPFGIVAIVQAAQVNSKLETHDQAGALEASEKAKKWCWVSLWVGLSIGAIYLIIILIGISSR
jgi:hypothetical protein